jgi:acylphosphatase
MSGRDGGEAPTETVGPGSTPASSRLEAVVRGRVQGVGFRYWVLKRSNGLGITGWVANESDGSVRVVAEGDPSSLDELEALLGRGPVGSIVETVQAVRMPATNGFARFEVRSGGHRGD